MNADERRGSDERPDGYHQGRYEPRESRWWFPYPTYGWLPWSHGGDADEPHREFGYDEEAGDRTEGSWWDEGLITLLLLVGVVLFVFPEPATSGLGIALIATAAFLWLLDWAM